MSTSTVDLDLLAQHLRSQLQSRKQSLRPASAEIGCSPATLSRLLKGSSAPNHPDAESMFKAISWLNKRVSDFEFGARPASSTIADVEVHLRALKDLPGDQIEALVAMVRAVHDAAHLLKERSAS